MFFGRFKVWDYTTPDIDFFLIDFLELCYSDVSENFELIELYLFWQIFEKNFKFGIT